MTLGMFYLLLCPKQSYKVSCQACSSSSSCLLVSSKGYWNDFGRIQCCIMHWVQLMLFKPQFVSSNPLVTCTTTHTSSDAFAAGVGRLSWVKLSLFLPGLAGLVAGKLKELGNSWGCSSDWICTCEAIKGNLFQGVYWLIRHRRWEKEKATPAANRYLFISYFWFG